MNPLSDVKRWVNKRKKEARNAARRARDKAEKAFKALRRESKRAAKAAKKHAKDGAGDAADLVAGAMQTVEEVVLGKDDVLLDDFPRKIQMDGISCGAQCAMAILEYYGHEYTEKALRKRLRTNRRGTSHKNLVNLFEIHDLACEAFSGGTRRQLTKAIDRDAPVLVELYDGNHWAVVYGYGDGVVYVADPSLRTPFVRWRWRHFRESWNGEGTVVN